MDEEYPAPVNQFLDLGEPEYNHEKWLDYIHEFELTLEHVPALLRMATDEQLHNADDTQSLVFAPVHAWRALGQLRAKDAILPLIALLEAFAEDDWATNDLPTALAMIGPPCIPLLEELLRNAEKPDAARSLAGTSLQHIAIRFPLTAGRIVVILHRQLQDFATQPPYVNASLIADLADLGAEGTLPTIARAYDADAVEEAYIGWEEVTDIFGALADGLRKTEEG